jgi:DNA invertase Pin-like site-specific DNA recombinase
MHILGAIAEFERARLAERVKAGLQQARAPGKLLGRPVNALPLERLVSVRAVVVD